MILSEEQINAFTWIEKQMAYLRYYSWVYLCNRFSPLFNCYGVPEKVPDNKQPVSFEDFCSDKYISKIDNGEDWEQRGFAQRYRVDYGFHNIVFWARQEVFYHCRTKSLYRPVIE